MKDIGVSCFGYARCRELGLRQPGSCNGGEGVSSAKASSNATPINLQFGEYTPTTPPFFSLFAFIVFLSLHSFNIDIQLSCHSFKTPFVEHTRSFKSFELNGLYHLHCTQTKMHKILRLTAVLLYTIITTSFAAPVVIVSPGNAGDIVVTKENTVNATTPAPTNGTTNGTTNENVKMAALSNGKLPLAMVNNFPGGAINAYVTGLDSQNRLVMLKPDGTFYYPSADQSVVTPQPITVNCAIRLGAKGSTKHITIPGYISSARVWFAEGNLEFFTIYSSASGGPSLVEPSSVNPADPSAGVNWGFVELTNIANGGLYANISYVDFVGLPLGMKLDCADGPTQTAEGLQAGSVASICKSLKAQGLKDGQPWGDLCMVNANGVPLRVRSF